MPDLDFRVQQSKSGGEYPTPTALVPVELNTGSIYGGHDRKRNKSGSVLESIKCSM